MCNPKDNLVRMIRTMFGIGTIRKCVVSVLPLEVEVKLNLPTIPPCTEKAEPCKFRYDSEGQLYPFWTKYYFKSWTTVLNLKTDSFRYYSGLSPIDSELNTTSQQSAETMSPLGTKYL